MNFKTPQYALITRPRYACSCSDRTLRFDCLEHDSKALLTNDRRRSNRLIPIELWEAIHGHPNFKELKAFYSQADTNGFSKVIHRWQHIDGPFPGVSEPLRTTTLYVHEGAFFRWFEKFQKKSSK